MKCEMCKVILNYIGEDFDRESDMIKEINWCSQCGTLYIEFHTYNTE